MLQGLQLMGQAEITELAGLAKLDTRLDLESLRVKVLEWAARMVGCSSREPLAIERAALMWVAEHWQVDTQGLDDNDELERAVRIRIASDAVHYLSPVWTISVAMIAAGPVDAIPFKIRLLDKAASLVVPSRSARQKLTDEWSAQAREWGMQALEQPAVQSAAESLGKNSERADQALILALVISLADGRLAFEEERLFKDIASICGLNETQVRGLITRVNERYWGHQTEVTPKTGVASAAAEREVAMQAAEKTLDSAGTLEGLCLEACDKVTSNKSESKEHAPKSGWQRVLGTVSGVKQFFTNKVRTEDATNLVRLIYLAILYQHTEAAAQAEAAAARARAAAPSEAAPAAPRFTEADVLKEAPRKIKLD